MTSRPEYRVTVYKTRGTELIWDSEHSRRGDAVTRFATLSKRHVFDPDVCVLLSVANDHGSETTLAAKSTDEDRVVYHAAFYRSRW